MNDIIAKVKFDNEKEFLEQLERDRRIIRGKTVRTSAQLAPGGGKYVYACQYIRVEDNTLELIELRLDLGPVVRNNLGRFDELNEHVEAALDGEAEVLGGYIVAMGG